MEDPTLMEQLLPGESLKTSHRINGSVLILPAFVLAVSLVEFSPWAFGGPGARLVAWVTLAYGALTGAMFWALYSRGRVALTDRRVLYLQKFPGRAADLMAWGPTDFDAVLVRKGVFGRPLGYGHLLLTKSGRLVTVIRSVSDLDGLATRIRVELLGQAA